MKRMRVLFGRRRFQALATMAVLLLAVSVAVVSGASFTATSANPGNVFTAGALTIGNFEGDGNTDNEGDVIANLPVSGMVPGDVATGTAVIRNTGTVNGVFTLTSDVLGSADLAFADYLDLQVLMDGAEIYNGAFSTALNNSLGTWAAGEDHTFVFNVTFPNGASDNDYMGDSATLNIAWSAVSD